ncbi:hypothetical protein [Numidum massiliense]|uniref:hypothetical protein n=1 Tax=Numidum massiliense TaxID=1522315 RepID=UPI0006D54AC2|nr:hypothetical protein [Numidum massiliense]
MRILVQLILLTAALGCGAYLGSEWTEQNMQSATTARIADGGETGLAAKKDGTPRIVEVVESPHLVEATTAPLKSHNVQQNESSGRSRSQRQGKGQDLSGDGTEAPRERTSNTKNSEPSGNMLSQLGNDIGAALEWGVRRTADRFVELVDSLL